MTPNVIITITTIDITVHAGALVTSVYAVALEWPTATTSHACVAMAHRRMSAAVEEYSTTDHVQRTLSGMMIGRDASTLVTPAENAHRSVPAVSASVFHEAPSPLVRIYD